MQEAVIAATVRTPVGRAARGGLKDTRPDDLAALVIQTALERIPGLEPADVEDVILGCVIFMLQHTIKGIKSGWE